ncbi:uncharacterized protein LOC132261461 [Phlebotomus argentipes]|uniref:uncharacterized protein LOC132261461 n=1 Tax=Phlebotomus argentipes TaxID=94469 RepID=UPI0028934325|nr:uncharacterized protein LOC132261461 [Phlebotomus argentipes]
MTKTLVTIFVAVLWANTPIAAYSRVATNGNIANDTDAEQVHGVSTLLTPDLNTTETPTSTTPVQETGRAADLRPFRLPFVSSGGVRRTQSRPPARTSSMYGGAPVARKQPQIVYPVYTPSNHRPANHQWRVQGPVAMDRYSPAEAYSAGIYKVKKKKQEQKMGYNYPKPVASFPAAGPAPAAAPPAPAAPGPVFRPAPPQPAPVFRPASPPAPQAAAPPMPAPQNTYIPPSNKDLYAFPPNVNSPYLPPQDAPAKSVSPVSSYLPPAAGPADTDSDFKFPGPVNPMYLPMNKPAEAPDAAPAPDSDDSNGDDSGSMDDQTTPSPPDHDDHFPDSFPDHYHDHDHDHDHYPHHHGHEVILDHPPPGYFDHYSDHHHYFDHAPATPAPAPTEAPTDAPAPADAMDDMAPQDMGMPNDSPFPDSYKYSGLYGVDASPELIYDHDPHHHYHHVEPTTTTEEPPPEPRVKKYSYYYLGRKLWYIPLYFTVWFTFYVAALIIRSIARHKVEIPEHYQARRKRDLDCHRETVRKVDKMAVFVMSQIEDFAHKYLQ